MHQPSYPPPQASPYPPPPMQQQLPPMPHPGHYAHDNLQMAAPPAPQQSPLSETAQSTSQPAERAPLSEQDKIKQMQNLEPYSSEDDNGWVYSLVVVQQPQRARMCGFGDKDRRPITPPPCVRLFVTDRKTGKEINCNEIEHTMYVLNVDLWSDDALKEVNLVRHTTATPSISSTTPASFASIEQSTPAYSNILPSSRDMSYAQMPFQAPSPQVSPYGMQQPQYSNGSYNNVGYAPPPQQYYSPHEFRPDVPNMAQLASQAPTYGPPRVYEPGFGISQRLSIGGSQPQGMFTRNLIGSLAASAFRLVDNEDKNGIWFVLQDLSVRTEGTFRLRFSFVNVGIPTLTGNMQPGINHGKAPVLASVFSDVFQVYSAKKFPGVCESTSLSKCFATQGIKIPIRKEGPKGGNADDDDDY